MGIVLWKRESIEGFLSVAIKFPILDSVLWVLVRGKLASEQGLVLPSAVLRLIYSRIFSRQNISQLEHSFSLKESF